MKRLIAGFSAAVLFITASTIGFASGNGTYAETAADNAMFDKFGDTQEAKLYIDRYDFSVNWSGNSDIAYNSRKVFSGWDSDEAGGRITISGESVLLSDTSTVLPVSLSKSFERADHGVMTLSMRVTVTEYADGFEWLLSNGGTEAVSVITQDNAFYLKQSGGMDKIGDVTVGQEYGFIIKADIDSRKADVYLDGKLVAAQKAFVNSTKGIDRFIMTTAKTEEGSFKVPSVSLERGYAIREYFEAQTSTALPETWVNSSSSGGSVSCKNYTCKTHNDNYGLVLNGTDGNAAVSKSFEAENGKVVFEFKQYMQSKRNGVEVALKSGSSTVLAITVNNGKFSFKGTNTQAFYEYVNNVWYTFRIVADLKNKTADVYLNGKKKLPGVAINGNSVDSVSFSAQKLLLSTSGKNVEVEYDDILLYKYQEDSQDYVSAPEIPQKKDSNTLVGMQMCPLWHEGMSIGWEHVSYYNDRIPYLGFYDEGNPEVSDWEIKWMAEHGVDFQWSCWFRPNAASAAAIKDVPCPALTEGYFYAKYSDRMKFAILYENQSSAYGNTDDFKNNIVPYWIEYFFKDDRYLKIDNRPVIGVFNYQKLAETLGGASGIKSAFDYLTAECDKNGIGAPIWVLSTFDADASNFAAYKSAGFECVYSYHRGSATPKSLKAYLNGIAPNTDLNVIPSLSVGYNDTVWQANQTDTHYGIATAKDYGELCRWANETYIPSLNDNNGIGKQLVMIDTWNEYGEGTYVMPSDLEGFGFLDAIRDAFTAGGEHNDSVPTDAQKDRFNNLYPYVNAQERNSRNPMPISKDILKEWSFDSSAEGWKADSQISELTVENGLMKGIIDGGEPCLSVNSLNIPIDDVEYIKIRIKNKSASNKGRISFETSKTHYNDYTQISFNINYGGDDYQDIYVPVYQNSLWKGTLTGLKLMPCLAGDVRLSESDRNRFEIDSISLICGNGADTISGIKVVSDGKPIDCSSSAILKDGIPYISVSKLQNIFDMLYTFDDDTQTAYLANFGTVLSMKINDGSIYKNGSCISGGGAVLSDGEVYVHYNVFSAMGYKTSWDEAKSAIYINSSGYGNGYSEITPGGFTVENQISAGEFEDANALLGINKNSAVTAVITADAHSGQGALKIKSTAEWQYSNVKVTVKPDTWYCVSAYAKTVSGSAVLYMTNGVLQRAVTGETFVRNTLSADTFTRCCAIFKANVASEQEIALNFGTNAASEIILDDLEFYEMPGLYQNAVMGGNFENGTGQAVPCYSGSTAELEITEDNPIYGDKSLLVSTTQTNNGVAVPAYIVPGERYYIKATVRLMKNSVNDTTFALRMSPASYGGYDAGDVTTKVIKSIGSAVTMQGFYTAPSNYNTILSCDGNEYQSYVSIAPWTASDFIIDDIEIMPISDDIRENTLIGEFELYKNYGTESCEKITGSELTEGEVTAALKNCENVGSTDKDITVIIALYKNGRMKAVNFVQKTMSAYSGITEPLAIKLDIPKATDDDKYEIRGFAFNNFDRLIPLTEFIHTK